MCKERGIDYDAATVEEIVPVHAEAERRLGQRLVELLTRGRGR